QLARSRCVSTCGESNDGRTLNFSLIFGDLGMVGGYDDGYIACPCFWGTEPGSLGRELTRRVPSIAGWRVLDVGCGEGKNAAFLAERGAHVTAIDISTAALRNARMAWGDTAGIDWAEGDARTLRLPYETYHLVIAYGILHCLDSRQEV